MQGYNYASAGAYFVTVCVRDRKCLFGNVVDGEIQFSDIGRIASRCWDEIPNHFPYVELDEYVVMPNHVHGIIVIKEHANCGDVHGRDVQLNVPTIGNDVKDYKTSVISPKRGSLSVIVRTYKAAVTT